MFENQIDEGVKYLNAVKPGWYNNIDTDKLSMSICSECVLGQTFGEFWGYRAVLSKTGQQMYNSDFLLWCYKYGFAVSYTDLPFSGHGSLTKGYNILTQEWIDKINQLKCDQQTLKTS